MPLLDSLATVSARKRASMGWWAGRSPGRSAVFYLKFTCGFCCENFTATHEHCFFHLAFCVVLFYFLFLRQSHSNLPGPQSLGSPPSSFCLFSAGIAAMIPGFQVCWDTVRGLIYHVPLTQNTSSLHCGGVGCLPAGLPLVLWLKPSDGIWIHRTFLLCLVCHLASLKKKLVSSRCHLIHLTAISARWFQSWNYRLPLTLAACGTLASLDSYNCIICDRYLL